MKKAFLFLSILLIIASLIAPAFKGYTQDVQEEIKLYLGEVKILPVNNPTRIVVSNPKIADVSDATVNEITITPKSVGTTTLIFWDNFGEQAFKIKVFAEDMNEVKRRIDNMLAKLDLPSVYTQAEEEEGRVILMGEVKTTQDKERITLALGPLKNSTLDLIELKEEEAIVEIDVQLLELTKDATTSLGFNWPSSINITEQGSPALTTSAQTQVGNTSTIAGGALMGTPWGSLFRVVNVSREAFQLGIALLAQEGKAKILSRPRLACQSGKEAELLVGGEKPVFTTQIASTTGGQGTEVEYKEYGIKLKMKPVVTDEKKIKLSVNVEVSELGTVEFIGATNARTAQAYPLTKRNASTELLLNDGQTMAIGGLMKNKSEEDVQKVPWLGDLPLVGLLFRKTTTKSGGGTGERADTELFITLTPTLISQKKEVSVKKKDGTLNLAKATAKVAPAADSTQDPVTMYATVIQKRILDNFTYPAAARQAGFQGTTTLGLHISYNGELLGAKIKSSSGYKILDDHALAVAKGVTSYPPFPSSIEQQELWVDVPVSYRLD